MPEAPLVIEHREALVYMLAEASELEHGIMCEYLFAAFSLKQAVEEGLTPEQLATVDGWRQELFAIASQEMLHFALVTNVLTALGYAPHVSRPNLPAPIHHYPAGVQLALVPFGEVALEHFLYLERPEGTELEDAPGFAPFEESVPLMGQDDIVPSRQGFATVGHLYRSLEAGLVRLVEKYGEERIFVGPPQAQATPETFGWPELLPVTDLASAQRAIEVIVEQGEGATGDVEHSHYGRFVAMRDDYLAMKAGDPAFEAARSCAPTFVRPPVDIDVEVESLCNEPMTAAVADIFNVGYEVMLQILARYFGHGHETLEEAQVLADTAVTLMRGVLQPVGQLLTRMPAYTDRPGVNAGPAFELFYDSDYLLPHRRAAWLLIGERLGDLASFAGRVAEDPAAPREIASVRDTVRRAAAGLSEHLQESSAGPEGVRGPVSPPPPPRPQLRPVAGRAELIALLEAAAELEHGSACASLFAAASLRSDVSEGALTDAQADLARGWKRDLLTAGLAGLGRVAQLGNLLTAVGGSPDLRRPAPPEPASADDPGANPGLTPFSAATMERLSLWTRPDDVVLPADRRNATGGHTLGDLYYRIGSALRWMPEQMLLIGPPEAQVTLALFGLPDPLIAVVDPASAIAAVEALVRRSDPPGKWEAAGFDPARPVAANPTTGQTNGLAGGTPIGDDTARRAAALGAESYDAMLAVTARLFGPGGETEAERRQLAAIAAGLLNSVVRPLGEALCRMPAGAAPEAGTAGPVFGSGEPRLMPAHWAAARVRLQELLWELAARATQLALTPGLPSEIKEATAGLQGLAAELAPAQGPAGAAAKLAELGALQAGLEPTVQTALHGPYLATNVDALNTWQGEPIPTRPQMALCRCGDSAIKPYCDGSHARIDFSGLKDPKRVPDRLDAHQGDELTVLDNRGICAHSGFCTDRLSAAFHAGGEPFVTPDGAPAADITRAVLACPSGALSYAIDGVQQRDEVDQERAPAIEVSKDGPYRIVGGLPLTDGHGDPESRAAGASLEHYSLCRCGHSQNKPFCSGMHWYINFHDPEGSEMPTEPDAEPEQVLPGPDETVSFAGHVKGLFRQSDRRSMQFAFDLGAYGDVVANAGGILTRLRDGSMPCDGAWPVEKIETFARWIDTGMGE